MKSFLILFILIGLPISLYGAREIWGSYRFVKNSTGRTTGTFAGYHRVTTTTSTLDTGNNLSQAMHATSVASYPEFLYRLEDGSEKRVREDKVHLFEVYRKGDSVEILIPRSGSPRIASAYSLYGRGAALLSLGLAMILFPLFLYHMIMPRLTGGGSVFPGMSGHVLESLRELKVGPVPLFSVFKFFGAFVAVGVAAGLLSAVVPYVRQARFGAGGRLLAALEAGRFDQAREMIASGSGINATNEFDQSPLLLALEAHRADLAKQLVQAGADVNGKSKMLMTPLRVATEAGDLEMVKLLLAHGASPNVSEGEFPPVTYAIRDGREDIALALVEAGMDLTRRYRVGKHQLTLGEVAVRAKMPRLEEAIREQGGPIGKAREATRDRASAGK